MKILVYGSLNIDRTYSVPHFVRAGETLAADGMELFRGGKGFNQAISLARAGAGPAMAGAVGEDGDFLLDPLKAEKIDISRIKKTAGASGHAVIQVDRDGHNCIIILAGANGEITPADVDAVLKDFEEGDVLVLQNEISSLDYLICQASKKGMKIVLNPSPITDALLSMDLSAIDYLLVNETEAAALAGAGEAEESPLQTLGRLAAKYPQAGILMTLGHHGAIFRDLGGAQTECGIYPVKAVDTTAAGDTYTGYFLAEYLHSHDAAIAMRRAAVASGLSVSRKGASPSIPYLAEVDAVSLDAVPLKLNP